MPTVTTPGTDSGITIRKKNPSRLAPSIEAASSSSLGMARRNGTRMMIVVGSAKAICGRMMPAQAVAQPQAADHDVQRRDRHRHREHQPGREQRVQRRPAAEAVAGEHEARHHAQDDDAEGRETPHDHRVAHLAPEDRALQHLGVVDELPRVGKPDGSTVISAFVRNPPMMM